MPFVLDNDTFSLTVRGNETVIARINETPAEEIWLSAVALSEAMKGRLATINEQQSKSNGDVPAAYASFLRTVDAAKPHRILPYTAQAEALYQSWPASVKRVGAGDCRIAASAIVSGFVIVTRNTRDYERIPGVVFVDWASEEAEMGVPSVPPILSQNVE